MDEEIQKTPKRIIEPEDRYYLVQMIPQGAVCVRVHGYLYDIENNCERWAIEVILVHARGEQRLEWIWNIAKNLKEEDYIFTEKTQVYSCLEQLANSFGWSQWP